MWVYYYKYKYTNAVPSMTNGSRSWRCVLFNQNVVKEIMKISGPVRLRCKHEVIDDLPLFGIR